MDRTKPGVTKTQVGFFNFVVLPLFRALTRALPGTAPVLETVERNYEQWEVLDALSKAHAGGTSHGGSDRGSDA